MRSIFFYKIPRELTDEAIRAAQAFIKWYEKPERWEREKVRYARFTVHETRKESIVVRMAN